MFIEFVTLGAFLLIVGAVFGIRALIRGKPVAVGDELAADAVPVLVFGDWTDALAEQLPPMLPAPDELTQDLRRAGHYKPSAKSEFLALRNVMTLVALILTGVYAVMVGPERPDLTMTIMAYGGSAAAVLYIAPWLYLRAQVRRRIALIQRALPDGFDMLTMCLTGGLGLQDGIAHVSRELHQSHPDLAVELEIVRRHAEMSSLGDAFRHFAKRIDIPEVISLAGLITQTERLGSNVVNAVREYTDGVRIRQRQTADERAGKAGIKLLFPLVLCLAPATLIILWGPAVLDLRNFFATFKVTN